MTNFSSSLKNNQYFKVDSQYFLQTISLNYEHWMCKGGDKNALGMFKTVSREFRKMVTKGPKQCFTAIDWIIVFLSFQLTTSDFSILNSLVPSLEKVATNHSKESSRALAIDLKVYIATRGAVTPDESVQRKPKKPSEVGTFFWG